LGTARRSAAGGRHRLEGHRTVFGDAKDLVDQRPAVGGDRRSDRPDELDLFIPQQPTPLDQHDARVKIARADELLEVTDVEGDQDSIFVVRAIEELLVGRALESTIAHMLRVDAVAVQRDGGGRRDVLIEQELDVHWGDRREVWAEAGKIFAASLARDGLTGQRELFDAGPMVFTPEPAPYDTPTTIVKR
jgi:hypothetical protein